jgi:hypothetical protein
VEREVKKLQVSADWINACGLSLLLLLTVWSFVRDVRQFVSGQIQPPHPMFASGWLEGAILIVALLIATDAIRKMKDRLLKFALGFFGLGLFLQLLAMTGRLPVDLSSALALTRLLVGTATLVFVIAFIALWFRKNLRIV